ncbi:MAG: hypothetical protein Aurels2KO_31140 [Aureliella sp.]
MCRLQTGNAAPFNRCGTRSVPTTMSVGTLVGVLRMRSELANNNQNGKMMSGENSETSQPLNFDTLRDANVRRNHEWRAGGTAIDQLPLSFRAAELAGEAGEACNEIKKIERHRLGLVGGKTDLQGLRQELADVLISVDLIAMDLDIDLAEAVREKFNATSAKHGMQTQL